MMRPARRGEQQRLGPKDASSSGLPSRYRLVPGPFPHHPEISQIVTDDHRPQLFDDGTKWAENRASRAEQRSPQVVLFDLRDPTIADTEAAGLIENLMDVGTRIWIWTNRPLEPLLTSVLISGHSMVRVTVYAACMDDRIQGVLDPSGATPRERLALVQALQRAGIQVDVGIEPLLPGVTDSNAAMSALLDAVAQSGCTRVTVGYLTLPESDRGRIEEALHEMGVLDGVMDAFVEGPVVRERGDEMRLLPKAFRQRGYALMMSLAAERGLTVRMSSISNPDFRRPPIEPSPSTRSLQETFRSRMRLSASHLLS